MNYTLPVIVNQNGSMADLSGDAVWKLPDEFDNGQLVEAMERMWQDPTLRQSLGEKARAEILENHNPHSCAEKYYQAIENFYSLSQSSVRSLVRSIVEIPQYAPDSKEKVDLSESIALNFPLLQPAKQIFVDISELVQRDVGSGIQRVTRSLLMQLLENPPAGYRIEPVYATNSRPGYYYARVFTSNFLGCPVDWATDERIEWSNGDVFLGLDLQPEIVPYQVEFLNCLHRYGVKTFFVVYDLLPVLHAEMFPPGADVPFGKWLRAICAFDGAVCISKSVAEELRNWRNKEINESVMPFKIGWFHLGADIEESVPSRGLPDDADSLLNKISAGSSFLMVGTIEPRKAHSQVLAAFEELWHREDLGVNLIIVGKQGWMVEKLIDTIRTHKELGKRLFWLEGVSDEYLVKIYASCSALIAASIAEGFGLPLIEAARHKIPIIARDIPVFREVAGEHAFYFSDLEPEKIADAIYKWINLHDEGKIPCSERIKWKTWSESSKDLLECILT